MGPEIIEPLGVPDPEASLRGREALSGSGPGMPRKVRRYECARAETTDGIVISKTAGSGRSLPLDEVVFPDGSVEAPTVLRRVREAVESMPGIKS